MSLHIGGTLIDSNDMHVLAQEEALPGIGEKFDCQVVNDQIGKGANCSCLREARLQAVRGPVEMGSAGGAGEQAVTADAVEALG